MRTYLLQIYKNSQGTNLLCIGRKPQPYAWVARGAFWPGAYFGPKYLIFHKAITLQLSVPNSTFQFYFFHHYHQFEIMASF